MPRDKLLGDRFKVQKWKWYLVDMRDFHNPVLVRKHLDNKLQATQFRDKYYDKNFEIINYKTALKYGLRDYINKLRRHGHHTSKYNYPSECISQLDRQLFRNNERQKARQKMRAPKLTETVVWEIMDDQPVLFVKRVSHYADNHWVYSEPVEGLKEFMTRYTKLDDLRHLSNIVRVLREYYDIGLYDLVQVVFLIYNKWGARIRRHCNVHPKSMPRDHEKIVKEFKARGFVEKDTLSLDEDEDSWVESIIIKPKLVHPELCWHAAKDKPLYDHYIYDWQNHIGIPGYTRVAVQGLEKRK